VYASFSVPARVERVDLQTGRRTLYGEIAPVERGGLKAVTPWYISADERSYTYWTWVQRSTLFTVKTK
jgi:hypothetical protein